MEITTYKPRPAASPKGKLTPASGICFWIAQIVLILAVFVSIAAAKDHPRFVPGQILIKPRAGVSETTLASKLNARGAKSRLTLRHLNVRVVNVSEENADAVLAALKNDPDIEFAERDYIAEAAFVPNDPYADNEWHLSKIQAFQAWGGTTGSGDVVVAVLDSGVNMSQPDLAGRLLAGYDFVNNTASVVDDFGHGTAVAGTVAADGNNGLGVAGVAYGCSVLPVKVMDNNGFAAYSTIATGIKYAVDHGARVINMSIAGAAPSSTLQDAINYAWSNNVVVVAAAGNNASSAPQYPAACNHVLSVSSTAPDDSLSYFSSYGNYVKISAPGETIWTTQRDLNNPYGAWRGTSFASPIVAGVAALVISANPTLSNDQVVSLLEQSADELGTPGYDTSYGYGRVNAFRAVSAASSIAGAVSPVPQGSVAVILSSPQPGPQLNLGSDVSLKASASASTPGGSITNIEFVVNGVHLAAGSGASFNYDWTPSQAGGYSVVAVATDDHGLSATSTAASIEVVSVENIAPTVAILSAPQNGARLTSPTVLMAGTASDNAALDRVEVTINNGSSQVANGTANWSVQASLVPGVNVVRVHSVDIAGNVSPDATRTFTYVSAGTLVVQVVGLGAVSPDLNGTQLEIGKTYTLKAKPEPGQAFAGWTGADSESPVLTFVMQSNLVLTANFVPSPFPAVRGSYAGLAANTNVVTPESSGYFGLTVTPSGAFSGKLLLGGDHFGFRGQFDLSGNSVVTVNRGTLLSPLNLTLHIDLTSGTDRVEGWLTDGAWVSEVSGDRNVFNAQINPAAQAGLRNFILQRADNTKTEAGVGEGRISTSGSANVTGSLEDGRKFKTSSMLAKNGDCPFYLSLNKGSEVVIGWLNFPKVPNPTASGTVLWVSRGTNTFTAQLQAASAP